MRRWRSRSCSYHKPADKPAAAAAASAAPLPEQATPKAKDFDDEPDPTTPISIASFKTSETPTQAADPTDAWRPDAMSPRGPHVPVQLPAPRSVTESHKKTVDTLAGKFEERLKWDRRTNDAVVIHKTPSKKVQNLHKALSDLDLKSPAVVNERKRAELAELARDLDPEGDGAPEGDPPSTALVPHGDGVKASLAVKVGYTPPTTHRDMKAADSDEDMVEFDFVDFAGMDPDMTIA